MAKRLSAFEMWAYRSMLRISWTEKVTNEEVLRKVRCDKRLYNIIQTKNLKYFGHIILQNGDTLPKTLIDGKVKGLRGRGRPRTTWATNIIKLTGLNYEQAVRQAQDRQKWRTIASNPRQEDGTWWWWKYLVHWKDLMKWGNNMSPSRNVRSWTKRIEEGSHLDDTAGRQRKSNCNE